MSLSNYKIKIKKSKKPFEIICIDDGSNKETLNLNYKISSQKVVYLFLKKILEDQN